jgi:L-threonylcarbamoyladenylate synthase
MAPTVTDDVSAALDVLRAGGLVAIPTETVYGLAADASNEGAVRRIFAAKGRPADHPLIVHLADAARLDHWASEVSTEAATLADACWPGPLTVLVARAPHVLDVVTGGRPSVGIRVPAHSLTSELLDRFGGGLAAPSANRFGRVSPTTAAHVLRDLGSITDDEGRPCVDLILDGGPCPIGVESTIVDCTVSPVQVLRPGGIPIEQVERLLRGAIAPTSGPSRAAGMLASHYAPACPVRLAETVESARLIASSESNALLIDDIDDLVGYAQQLYDRLRRADDEHRSAVVAVLPPPIGLGHAIRDRLFKAAADRPG